MARARFDPEYDPGPINFGFGGYRGSAPISELHEMFRQNLDHGTLYCAGGYGDQPDWWRADMAMCRTIYNAKASGVIKEVKARPPKPTKGM